jgi:hypothetical protein
LDVGADYGSTALYFLEKGAKRVIAVESDPDLFNQLKSNLETESRVVPIMLKIARPEDFEYIISRFCPDVLKVDCEGCEIHLEGVTAETLTKVPEYLIEVHDHIGCPTKSQIQHLFEAIGYLHETYEVLLNVAVVHAKKSWDYVQLSEQEIVQLKNAYFVKDEKLRDAKTELDLIKSCFGYTLMRFYGRILDKFLPNDTVRGKIKNAIISLVRKHAAIK